MNAPVTHTVSFFYSDGHPKYEVYYDFSSAIARYNQLNENRYGLQHLVLRQRGTVINSYEEPFGLRIATPAPMILGN